jgi:hypothetical protein
MAHVVTLTFEVVEHQTGLWCQDCALSSGVALTLAMTGAGRASLSTVRRCADCGGDEVE